MRRATTERNNILQPLALMFFVPMHNLERVVRLFSGLPG
jgi:hypothetical protein